MPARRGDRRVKTPQRGILRRQNPRLTRTDTFSGSLYRRWMSSSPWVDDSPPLSSFPPESTFARRKVLLSFAGTETAAGERTEPPGFCPARRKAKLAAAFSPKNRVYHCCLPLLTEGMILSTEETALRFLPAAVAAQFHKNGCFEPFLWNSAIVAMRNKANQPCKPWLSRRAALFRTHRTHYHRGKRGLSPSQRRMRTHA